MIKLLKHLAGHEDDAATLNATLQQLDCDLATAQQVLAKAQASYGDELIDAGESAGYSKVEAELDARRRDVARLEAARNAVERRLLTARQRDAERTLADRWAMCDDRLEARHKSFDAVDRAVLALAKAVQGAERAAADVWEATPIRIAAATGAAPYSLQGEFLAMAELAHRRLDIALYTLGMVGNSTLYEAAKAPPLAEQSRRAGADLLLQREQAAQLSTAA